MTEATWPPPGATQLCWCVSAPPMGRNLLAAFVKRTYRIEHNRLVLADQQAPLVIDPELGEEEDWLPSWLIDDTDLVAPKLATDVIVSGSAHFSQPSPFSDVDVAVGKSARRIRAFGPRQVEMRPDGSARFTEPELVSAVALIPQNTYGGRDLHAQHSVEMGPEDVPMLELPEELRSKETVWLFDYARNPVGKGFFLDFERERANGAALPQLEDPGDLLTTARLFRASPLEWLEAPSPGLLGWVHHSWFPRMLRYVGQMIEHAPPTRELRERAFADGDDLDISQKPQGARIAPRALQGAAPGLAVERLRGDETVILNNLHPERPHMELRLPGERPTFQIRPSYVRAISPEAILQTVRLEPDNNSISLTWVAAVPTLTALDEGVLANTELSVTFGRL